MNGKTAKLIHRVAIKRGAHHYFVRQHPKNPRHHRPRLLRVDVEACLKSQWRGTPRNERHALRRRWRAEVAA